jgi:serine/threonine protein kinase
VLYFQRYMREPENEEHQEFFDLVNLMLTYDPSERIILRQSLRHPFLAPYFKSDRVGSPSCQNNGDREWEKFKNHFFLFHVPPTLFTATHVI